MSANTLVSPSEIRSLINNICASLNTANEDYSDVQNDEILPQAFAVVAKHLQLVQSILQITKSHLQNTENKPDTGMQRILRDGKKQASNLETLFHSVASDDGTPLLERYPKAVSKIGRGTRVELTMESLLKNIKKMTENPTIKDAPELDIEALKNAIEEVSELEPSLVDEEGSGGPTVNVWGGVANTNFGDGKQYVNSGKGSQYNAETQHFAGSG